MTTNKAPETTYCSESEDDYSEHPLVNELPEFVECDAPNLGEDDGTFLNRLYDVRQTVPEKPQSFWVYPHYPVQLTSASSQFETFDDVRVAADEIVDQEQKLIAEQREIEAAEDQMFLDAKAEDKERRDKFLASLPVESRSGRKARLQKEQEESIRKERERRKARKLKLSQQGPLPFGHRRNGGGKKRSHIAPSPEVLQTRRSAHRKERKLVKKSEEECRAEDFATGRVVVNTSQTEYLKIAEKDKTEEEEEEEILMRETVKIAVLARWDDESSEDESEDEIRSPAPIIIPMPPSVWQINPPSADGWETVQHKKSRHFTSTKSVPATPSLSPTVVSLSSATSHPNRQTSNPTSYQCIPIPNVEKLRTQMCFSVRTGKPCPHGVRCRFAHSRDQLSILPCNFGTSCRFVNCRYGNFVNRGQFKICKFLHSQETKENYFTRINRK